jgi:hypothetical protein
VRGPGQAGVRGREQAQRRTAHPRHAAQVRPSEVVWVARARGVWGIEQSKGYSAGLQCLRRRQGGAVAALQRHGHRAGGQVLPPREGLKGLWQGQDGPPCEGFYVLGEHLCAQRLGRQRVLTHALIGQDDQGRGVPRQGRRASRQSGPSEEEKKDKGLSRHGLWSIVSGPLP